MGTNYFHTTPANPCVTCGHDPDGVRLHIGKASAGWCFALRLHPDQGILTIDDWIVRIKGPGLIVDEYGRGLDAFGMLSRILHRGWHGSGAPRARIFRANEDAEPGPNGLLRHRLGGLCVEHGEGTYDYMIGDFL